jgi:hypothetical protein
MPLRKPFLYTFAIALGILAATGVLAWTGPSASAPSNNASAPLNVSNVGQVKVGGLQLNTGGAATGLIVGGAAQLNGAITGTYGLTPSYTAWSTYGTGAGGAAIYNDSGTYKTLMIVGNNSAGGARNVGIWDNLNVNGAITANGVAVCLQNGTNCPGNSAPSQWTTNGSSIYYNGAQVEAINPQNINYGVNFRASSSGTGNSDGVHIAFNKYNVKAWTVGILNGGGVGTFSINEDGDITGFGTPRLTIANGGNVGIGTASPTDGKLQVAGGTIAASFSRDGQGSCCSGSGSTLALSETTNSTGKVAGIQFHDAGVSEGYFQLANGGQRRFQIGDNQGVTTGLEMSGPLYVDSTGYSYVNGNLGIGSAQLGTNGDLYMPWAGKWLSTYLSGLSGAYVPNQHVDTTSWPTFGGLSVSASSVNNWISVIHNTGSGGYGMYIQPGSDNTMTLGLLNTAGSAWTDYFQGNGNTYLSQSGGGTYIGGSVQAPIFYDSGNTGYYVQPSATSNINTLNMNGPIAFTGNRIYLWSNGDTNHYIEMNNNILGNVMRLHELGSIFLDTPKVGIGTASPTQALDVNGYVAVRSTNGEGGTIELQGNNGVNMWLENDNGGFRLINSPWNAGIFNVDQSGNVSANGSMTASAFYYNSDERLKKNIVSIASSTALADILALNPVTFNWIDPAQPTTTQLGFIAQQVEKIVPEIVSTNASTTMKAVDYARVTPLLVGAVQQQQAQIDAQNSKIDTQQKEIDALAAEVAALKATR